MEIEKNFGYASSLGDRSAFVAPLHGLPQRRSLWVNVVMNDIDKSPSSRQYLHLVFGGELESLDSARFADVDELDIVGIFPNYQEARKAWNGAAQKSVDNALMRYFIVHIHRLVDPLLEAKKEAKKKDKSDA